MCKRPHVWALVFPFFRGENQRCAKPNLPRVIQFGLQKPILVTNRSSSESFASPHNFSIFSDLLTTSYERPQPDLTNPTSYAPADAPRRVRGQCPVCGHILTFCFYNRIRRLQNLKSIRLIACNVETSLNFHQRSSLLCRPCPYSTAV